MRYLVSSLFLLCWFCGTVAAQDTFIVQTLVGTDTTAPTTPLNLVATAVSPTQIDLSWDAAADNIAVAGYQLWRDGSQIATTTLTSYSDTGLNPSTLYSYYVVAFDTSFNYSSSSASSSATTLASSTPPVTGDGGGSSDSLTPVPTIISDVVVTVTQTGATITYTTNVYTTSYVRWGVSSDYESGYVASDVLRKQHVIQLTDLQPDTEYQASILAKRKIVDADIFEAISFKTLPEGIVELVENVTSFQAGSNSEGVALTWQNPTNEQFSYVTIVGSDIGYPSDPNDGWLVYQGGEMTALDKRKMSGGARYYTAFVFSKSGARSSGVALRLLPEGTVTDGEQFAVTEVTGYEQFSIAQLNLLQNGSLVPSDTSVQLLDSQMATIFSLPRLALPPHLKSVIVTLAPRTEPDGTFSFLLAATPDNLSYEGVIAPLQKPGIYDIYLEVYDYRQQVIIRRTGEVIFYDAVEDGTVVIERTRSQTVLNWPLLGAVLLMFVLALYSFLRHIRK